jgi:hypothetical protein
MRWIVLGIFLAGALGGAARAADQAVNAELIRLHDDLRLNPAQEVAWRDYTRAIAPTPESAARHQATTALLPSIPTPRRIALIEATMAQDAADFRRQGAAVTDFYARLTPEQQGVFDRETLPSDTSPRP